METLSVGMYCRTLNGIVKIDKIKDSIIIDTKGKTHFGDLIKSSYNIIDILEVGDYVNGHLVKATYLKGVTKYIKLDNAYENGEGIRTYTEDIKSVITKEQFEQMAYKVGE